MNLSPEAFTQPIKATTPADDLGNPASLYESSKSGYSNRIAKCEAFASSIIAGSKKFNAIQINVYLRQPLVEDGFALKGWVHANPEHVGSAGIWFTQNYKNPGNWEVMWTPPYGPNYESCLRPVRKNAASAVLYFVPYEQDLSKVNIVNFWVQSWLNDTHEWVDGWYRNDRHVWYPHAVNYP